MSGFLHDDQLCARNSVDADGFVRAVREFGRLADVLGLPDTGLSFAEIVDATADRIAAVTARPPVSGPCSCAKPPWAHTVAHHHKSEVRP